jgi:hypothetical protein
MLTCPDCNTVSADHAAPCAQCGALPQPDATQRLGAPVIDTASRIAAIFLVVCVLIVLGVLLTPYIVWSLAGPMPSLG